MVGLSYGPRDLPELRAELHAWYADGRADLDFDSRVFAPGKVALSATDRSALGIALSGAPELFYASSEMAELAVQAAKTVPDFKMQAEDLPARNGLLYTPFALWQYTLPVDVAEDRAFDQTISVVGFVWRESSDGTPDGEVVFAWLTNRDEYTSQMDRWAPELVESVRHGYSRLYETHVPLRYPLNHWFDRESAENPETVPPAAIVRTFFALMQQTITSITDEPLDRATRRRLERKRILQTPLRVITLRRAAGESAGGHSDREYLHNGSCAATGVSSPAARAGRRFVRPGSPLTSRAPKVRHFSVGRRSMPGLVDLRDLTNLTLRLSAGEWRTGGRVRSFKDLGSPSFPAPGSVEAPRLRDIASPGRLNSRPLDFDRHGRTW